MFVISFLYSRAHTQAQGLNNIIVPQSSYSRARFWYINTGALVFLYIARKRALLFLFLNVRVLFGPSPWLGDHDIFPRTYFDRHPRLLPGPVTRGTRHRRRLKEGGVSGKTPRKVSVSRCLRV